MKKKDRIEKSDVVGNFSKQETTYFLLESAGERERELKWKEKELTKARWVDACKNKRMIFVKSFAKDKRNETQSGE